MSSAFMKKVTYNPRFDILAAKSSLCEVQINASKSLHVDFRFVPPCFSADPAIGVLDAGVQKLAAKVAGNESMWVAKKDYLAMGDGIFFLSVPELAEIRSLEVPLIQRALMEVPVFHERKVEIRNFLAVTSMDPPRIYACRNGIYKTTGHPLVPQEVITSLPILNRSATLVANVKTPGMKRYLGNLNNLKREFLAQGLSTFEVETQIMEKITTAFLAIANHTSCQNADQPYKCEGHVAFGITDSLVDMATKEPYLLELMVAQSDWVFRGQFYGHPDADKVARAALQPLTRIALSSLRPEMEDALSRIRWPKEQLSLAATKVLEDERAHPPLKAMLLEAEAAEASQCSCIVCQDPDRFVKFFPRGAASESFGHPWLAYYELLHLSAASSVRGPGTITSKRPELLQSS
ncbi:unnamed protein product [Symbiodinium pilosum]|uniref:Uncharacterized protein n=1 Tax=Symbiodinium pilosum TaxID=2952 RepID=A0A812JH29_SYMPI|nr:unnamed protein product [Symbiodinium pilosum]